MSELCGSRHESNVIATKLNNCIIIIIFFINVLFPVWVLITLFSFFLPFLWYYIHIHVLQHMDKHLHSDLYLSG